MQDKSLKERLDQMQEELDCLRYERNSVADIVFSINERMAFLEGMVLAQRKIIEQLSRRLGLISDMPARKNKVRENLKLTAEL